MSAVTNAAQATADRPHAGPLGATQGSITTLLRIEAGLALAGMIMGYHVMGGG